MDTIVSAAQNRAHSAAIAALARVLPADEKERLRAELHAEFIGMESTRAVDPCCTDFAQVQLAEYIGALAGRRQTRRPGKAPAVKLSSRHALRTARI